MYFSYSYILAVFGPAVVWASRSQDFLANPEKYFRDPCPDERPDTRCTALDEYVWKDDGKYSWRLVEEYDDFANVKERLESQSDENVSCKSARWHIKYQN